MAENLENQKEAATSAEDVKPQRLLLLEQFLKQAEHSIPEVDDFLSKTISNYGLEIKPMNMEFLKLDKFFEAWLCFISPRLTTENSLIFEDGTCFTRQQLELIYGIDFANALVQLLLSLQTFSKVELKLFTAVAVLSHTSTDSLAMKTINFFDNDKEAQKLKDYCVQFFDVDISQKLLKLRELVKQHNSVIEWFSKNYWPKLDISTLIALRLCIPISPDMRTASSTDLTEVSSVAKIVEALKIHSLYRWSEIMIAYLKAPLAFAHADLETLTKKDRSCLYKKGLIETWFCTVSHYMTTDPTKYRPMGDERNKLVLIYGLDFINALMETSLSLQPYLVSQLELQLFQNIVLFSQRPGLVNVEAVQKLQDCAIEKFKAERLKNPNYFDYPPLDIPQTLSKLQSLSVLHLKPLDWMKKNAAKLDLTAFFCELFEIPKYVLKK